MTWSAFLRCISIIPLVVLVLLTLPAHSQEVAGAQLSIANNSVSMAFAAVYSAEQNGGDVSALVEKLNTAIFLIQRAEAENATDPSAAAFDLSNATTIAQGVSFSAATISSNGSAARQLRLYGSLGTVVATLGIAALAYLRGDRVYRRLWLYVYRNHLVKRNDE